MREGNFVLMCVSCFFLYCKLNICSIPLPYNIVILTLSGGLFVPFDYIVVEAIHYGVSPYLAISLIPIMNGARYAFAIPRLLAFLTFLTVFFSFVGRTVPNYIAEKVGRFTVMIVMTILTATVVLALWLPGRGNGASITFAVLFRVTSGAAIGLGPVLVASISPQ